MPEWAENASDWRDMIGHDYMEHHVAITALRADRDWYKNNAEQRALRVNSDWIKLHHEPIVDLLNARIRDLSDQIANQKATIDELRRACDSWGIVPAKPTPPPDELTKPKPADDWRARCTVDENRVSRVYKLDHWYIRTVDEVWNWSDVIGWTKGAPKYYRTRAEAAARLATIPTPPPDAAKGDTE